jgi:hypothetical protein
MIHLNLDMPHLQIPKLQSALSCGLLRLVVAHLCKEQKKGQFCFGVWFSLAYSWASIFGSFKSPESKNGSSKICNDIVYNPQPHTWSETVFPRHVLWNRSGNPPCHLLLPFFGFGWIIYNFVTTISPSQSHFISGDLCSQTGCCPHVFPSFQQGEAPQLWVGL